MATLKENCDMNFLTNCHIELNVLWTVSYLVLFPYEASLYTCNRRLN